MILAVSQRVILTFLVHLDTLIFGNYAVVFMLFVRFHVKMPRF